GQPCRQTVTVAPVQQQLAQCQDGIDNDFDGAVDYPNDFSCSSPNDNDETLPMAQCQDGIDNDGDGLVDVAQDPGCTSLQDNSEFNVVTPTLTASCVANPNPIYPNQQVSFFSNVAGGNGNYTYSWT